MSPASTCPICKIEDQKIEASDFGERLSLDCPRCGTFTITRTAKTMAEGGNLGTKLSAYLRDRTEMGSAKFEIDSRNLLEIQKLLPDYSVTQKQLILLRAIERKTEIPGHDVLIRAAYDSPLAWAATEQEFRYHLRSLIGRGFLVRSDGRSPDLSDAHLFPLQITPSGWEFLETHTKPGAFNDQAFVAMAFGDDLKRAWEQGIRIAVQKAGFKPMRVDADPHIDRIDAKIITEIKNSRFVVADVTHQRPGVYFEAGFAIGLGLPVIWTVRDDDKDNLHFDTRQYNHIIWKSEEHLADELFLFISAVIGSR